MRNLSHNKYGKLLDKKFTVFLRIDSISGSGALPQVLPKTQFFDNA